MGLERSADADVDLDIHLHLRRQVRDDRWTYYLEAPGLAHIPGITFRTLDLAVADVVATLNLTTLREEDDGP